MEEYLKVDGKLIKSIAATPLVVLIGLIVVVHDFARIIYNLFQNYSTKRPMYSEVDFYISHLLNIAVVVIAYLLYRGYLKIYKDFRNYTIVRQYTDAFRTTSLYTGEGQQMTTLISILPDKEREKNFNKAFALEVQWVYKAIGDKNKDLSPNEIKKAMLLVYGIPMKDLENFIEIEILK